MAKTQYWFTALVRADLDQRCTWLHPRPCPVRSCRITPHLQQGQGFALTPPAFLGTNGFFDLAQDSPETKTLGWGSAVSRLR